MMDLLPDLPIAQIGPDHEYIRVSRGWAALYSPNRDPSWWSGRNHIDAFFLDSHPIWRAYYDKARDGEVASATSKLSFPGHKKPVVCQWYINPRTDGGVTIVVLPAEEITETFARAVN